MIFEWHVVTTKCMTKTLKGQYNTRLSDNKMETLEKLQRISISYIN